MTKQDWPYGEDTFTEDEYDRQINKIVCFEKLADFCRRLLDDGSRKNEADYYAIRLRKEILHRMGATLDAYQQCYRYGDLAIAYESAIFGPLEGLERFYKRAKEEA